MRPWIKAIRRGDIVVDLGGKQHTDARKRYDWTAIQAAYATGATYRACRARFGFSPSAWSKAVSSGRNHPRPHRRMTAEEALRTARSRWTIKRCLLESGIIENRCDWCGVTEWRGKPLSIQIDHINGIKDDHRVENLRMLCPNCHSQTETFAAKNRSKLQR